MFMPLARAAAKFAGKTAAPSLGRYFAEQVLKTLALVGVQEVVKETTSYIHRKMDRQPARAPRKPARSYRACA